MPKNLSSDDYAKSLTQSRFGQYAQGYVDSQTHAQGADLERLVELANPQPDYVVLDVATGGGHTALKLAPYVARVVASDLTSDMLTVARRHITKHDADNVAFCCADAENLPFSANTFNLVTCRIAPHHFPDVFRFVRECERVLRPGGKLLVQDHVLPDDKRAARYIDAFERLRDPSHILAYAEYEWRGHFLDAGLTVEHTETFSKTHEFIPWAERQGCTPETIKRLQIMLVQSPSAVAEWIRPRHAGTEAATFEGRHIIIMGRKES